MSITSKLFAFFREFDAIMGHARTGRASGPTPRPIQSRITVRNVDGWHNPVADAITRHGNR